MAESTSSPRKKSRFFSNRNLKLEISSNSKTGEHKLEENTNPHDDLDANDAPSNEDEDQFQSAVRAVDSNSINRYTHIGGNVARSTDKIETIVTSHNGISQEDACQTGKLKSSANLLSSVSEPLVFRDRRRNGVCGTLCSESRTDQPFAPFSSAQINDNPIFTSKSSSVAATQQLLSNSKIPNNLSVHTQTGHFVALDQRLQNRVFVGHQHSSLSVFPSPQSHVQAELHMENLATVNHTTKSCTDRTPFAAHSSLPDQPINSTSLDLDRDAVGTLLPKHLRGLATNATTTQPAYVRYPVHTYPTTPANSYTSPKRLEHAIAASILDLKRKRTDIGTAPPAYVYVRSNDPNFNIFTHGFLLYPELCFALVSQMPLRDLISLYAISRDFHTIIDSRFTTTCLLQALRKAPESAQTFHFRMYAQYCRQDPAARLPHPVPSKAALQIPRTIPSFQWVAFVLHREKVVHELMTVFAERGCPLPSRCCLALKRMWRLMDVPDNARRVAMIHNHRLITDLDLYFMMCFFVKLDMVANDPVAPEKRDGLRKLLLSQQGGLDIILKVLKREIWQKKADLMMTWIETMMSLENLNEEQLHDIGVDSVFGVQRNRIGLGKYEYWGLRGINDEITGRRRGYLLRPDQLVLREAIRRGLRFTYHFLRCILYGYIRPDTLENYQPRKYGRRVGEWRNEDYIIDDSVGGLRALTIEDGGDRLLDLGNKDRGSRWTIQKEIVSEQERAMREQQGNLLQQLYKISEMEQLDQ